MTQCELLWPKLNWVLSPLPLGYLKKPLHLLQAIWKPWSNPLTASPYNTPRRMKETWPSPFYRWENWGFKRCSLPRIRTHPTTHTRSSGRTMKLRRASGLKWWLRGSQGSKSWPRGLAMMGTPPLNAQYLGPACTGRHRLPGWCPQWQLWSAVQPPARSSSW